MHSGRIACPRKKTHTETVKCEMTVKSAGNKLKGLQPESEHRLLEMGWVKSHPLERESG